MAVISSLGRPLVPARRSLVGDGLDVVAVFGQELGDGAKGVLVELDLHGAGEAARLVAAEQLPYAAVARTPSRVRLGYSATLSSIDIGSARLIEDHADRDARPGHHGLAVHLPGSVEANASSSVAM